MEIPEKYLEDARRLKQYFPFRRIFIIRFQDGEYEVVAQTDRRYTNKMMREGATVWELKFD